MKKEAHRYVPPPALLQRWGVHRKSCRSRRSRRGQGALLCSRRAEADVRWNARDRIAN